MSDQNDDQPVDQEETADAQPPGQPPRGPGGPLGPLKDPPIGTPC